MQRSTDHAAIEPYLRDASNYADGYAEGIVFPETEKEVVEFMRECAANKTAVTVSGNGGGLTGARVPLGGWVLATDKLGGLRDLQRGRDGNGAAIVGGPALDLETLQHAARLAGFFYPPDPTRRSSFLGGTVATNASGPRTFQYGATRAFVRRLRVVLASGEVTELVRGRIQANDAGILPIPATDSAGRTRTISIPVPKYKMPDLKHAAGYYAKPGMDAIDLFIGSEGTLGITTEIEVGLLPNPGHVFAMLVFFPSEEKAWQFAEEARERSRHNRKAQNDAAVSARALEYFDGAALNFMRPHYQDIPAAARAAIYIEQECQAETQDFLLEQWYILFENHGAFYETPWLAEDEEALERLHAFRHGVAEQVRQWLQEHGRRKIGTDYAVPAHQFAALMRLHREGLEANDLQGVTFGHIGDCHVHLNILPRTEEQSRLARVLYEIFVDKVLAMGGTISAEHGVGKLKRDAFRQMVGDQVLAEMAAAKLILDPKGLLGRGNLFPG